MPNIRLMINQRRWRYDEGDIKAFGKLFKANETFHWNPSILPPYCNIRNIFHVGLDEKKPDNVIPERFCGVRCQVFRVFKHTRVLTETTQALNIEQKRKVTGSAPASQPYLLAFIKSI
jgi:hypothetical protein